MLSKTWGIVVVTALLVSMNSQVMAGDWLYVQSGYSMFGQLPGNVLLAYRVRRDD